LLGLRANSELCSLFGSLGDHGSESSGSPVVASTKRWNCEESAKGSVGESHVCGRGFFGALPLGVEFETVVSGNVRARVGEGSKGASREFIGAAYPCEAPYGWYTAVP
jgi:hypothetical protein